jgi:hypothetical protein
MVRQRAVEASVLLTLAAAALWDGGRLVLLERASQPQALEAGGYEIVLAGLLACLAVLYWKRERLRPGLDWKAEYGRCKVLIGFAILAGCVAAMPYLGYLLSTAVLFVAYLRMFSSYRWLFILAMTVVAAVGSAWLWTAVDLSLPQGIFLPWP